MPGRVSDMMYHESTISDACGSVTTTRPSVQEPGTSASGASTPIRLSEQEPVTPSRLSEYDNESPRTSRQTEPRTTTARSSRRFNRPSPRISVSGYYTISINYVRYVTRHEKIGLMCTKYTPLHYYIYLTFCTSYIKSATCIK